MYRIDVSLFHFVENNNSVWIFSNEARNDRRLSMIAVEFIIGEIVGKFAHIDYERGASKELCTSVCKVCFSYAGRSCKEKGGKRTFSAEVLRRKYCAFEYGSTISFTA